MLKKIKIITNKVFPNFQKSRMQTDTVFLNFIISKYSNRQKRGAGTANPDFFLSYWVFLLGFFIVFVKLSGIKFLQC